MLMGIHDLLEWANTPEEREEMIQRFLNRRERINEPIDFSDIPEIKDFSRFKPLRPYVDKMRAHNLKVEQERLKTNS